LPTAETAETAVFRFGGFVRQWQDARPTAGQNSPPKGVVLSGGFGGGRRTVFGGPEGKRTCGGALPLWHGSV